MSKRVALVGHCGPDSSYLRMSVAKVDKNFKVVSIDDTETLESALKDGVELLLINRVIDYGFEEDSGVELIRKYSPLYPKTRMMLVSNYPDSQSDAVKAGAVMGFGKRDLGSQKVSDVIHAALK